MLQQQLHRVERHAINKDWMFKMERGENAKEFLRSPHTERRDQHGSTAFNDLCDLLHKLLLQSLSNWMILRRVSTLQDYPIEVLVLWVRPIDEPSGLTVEVSGVQQSLPVTLNNRLRTAGKRLDRKSTRLNSSHTVISYAVFCLKKKKQVRKHVTH